MNINGKSKDLIDYLNFIGIITESTIEIFIKSYKQILNSKNKKKQEIDIYNFLFNVLELYFNSIKREDKSSIANCIILKYLQNKEKMISNSLISIIKNYENKTKFIYLILWIEKIKQIKEESLYQKELKIEEERQLYENLNHYQKSQYDLLNRQKRFINKYNMNKLNKLSENEKLNNMLCPFSPIMETKNSKNEKLFLKSSERNPYKRLYNDINKRIEKRKKKEDEINLSIKKNSLFKISNPLTKKINRNMNDLNKNIINENNDIYLFQQFSNLSSFHKRNYTTNFIYNNDNKSYYFSNNNVKIRNSSKKNKYKNKLEYRSITPNIREYN
jgi:hypothetical protein